MERWKDSRLAKASVATAVLVVPVTLIALAAEPEGTPQPASAHQNWPPQGDSASEPNRSAPNTDPDVPKSSQGDGEAWSWTVKPPTIKGSGGGSSIYEDPKMRCCDLHIQVLDAEGNPMPKAKLGGTVSMAQKTTTGANQWDSKNGGMTWFSKDCKNPMPADGFTFKAVVSKNDKDKVDPKRIQFVLTNDGSDTITTTNQICTVRHWTDPVTGKIRNKPLTGPVAQASIQPGGTAASGFAREAWGVLCVTPGTQIALALWSLENEGHTWMMRSSVELDNEDGPDASGIGIKAAAEPVPPGWVSFVPPVGTFDSSQDGTTTMSVAPGSQMVGESFYIQLSLGAQAAAGSSNILEVRFVHSAADYDGDTVENEDDRAPFDPAIQ